MNPLDALGSNTSNTSKANGSMQELGQEDFIKLLVAQLKNQDPSNPSDNGEFLSQIAQFTMVDGIDGLGKSFDGIAGSFFAAQSMQAAALVDREVLAEGNKTVLQAGQGISGYLEAAEGASAVRLQIMNESGSLIRSVSLSELAGREFFSWDGMDENGQQQPEGLYQLQAEGLVNGELSALPLSLFSRVESVVVNRSGGDVSLQLANGEQIGFSQVREYR